MIPVLYPSTETSFTNNGLGGLPDAISCVVTEQRNTQGGYYLEMDYPIDGLHYADIAPERIIYAAPAMGKTPQPFRISRIKRPIDGIVHIEAMHVSSELQKIVTYGRMRAYTVWGLWSDFKGVATNLGQTCDFTISTDINLTVAINFWFDEPISMMDLLMGVEGSMIDKIGGEIEFDKWNVDFVSQRGVDSGLEIRYGVNMSDIEAETDATELVTAVIPFWKGTVNDADTVVVGDMCSASNASAYSYVRCVPLDVTEQFDLEQDEQPTKADVTAKGTDFINSTSRKLLQTSIKVKYESTTNGIGERLINLCDTVRVVYPDLGVSSISKVVETRFNTLTERYDELTIGTIRNNIVDTIAGLISGGAITGGGGSSGGGSTVSITPSLSSGTKIADFSIDGTSGSLYAPSGGGGGGAVDSVNGQTGVVVLTASDVGAVATESGKGLSTNDFTTAEKNKLTGIASGAEVNVQADWNQTDTTADDYIKNKPANSLPAYTSSDAFKKLRVNYNATALEWAAESGDHTIFYINESTLALDNGAKGSDITQALLSDFKSVYIIGNESYSGGVKFNLYLPLNDDAPTRDIESVSFYRPTTNGIVVLNILAGQNVATKTTIPFGGGGSSGVSSWNGMTGDVTYTPPVTSVNGMTGDVVVPSGGSGVLNITVTRSGTVGSYVYTANKTADEIMANRENLALTFGSTQYTYDGYLSSGTINGNFYFSAREIQNGEERIAAFKIAADTNADTVVVTRVDDLTLKPLPSASSADVGKVPTVTSSGVYTLQTPYTGAYTIHLTGNATNGYQITESAADIMVHYPNLVILEEAGGYDDEYFLVGAVVDFDRKDGYLQFTRDDLSFTSGTVHRTFVHISIGWDPERPSAYGTNVYKGETYLRNLPQATSAQNGKLLGVVGGAYAFVNDRLPAVTSADNGKVLKVVNGVWTAVAE